MAVITCVEDLRQLAAKRVPRMFYDYADTGSWTESTYRANESDFQKIKLRQRVAVNIERRSLATKMIDDVAMPVALAPTGLTGMQHADGEILAARAAEKFGVPFSLSTMSICSIEDVAANTTKPFWFQLYVMRDRDFVERLIDRAKAARSSALMLTLDLQVLGQRHKDLVNGLSTPPRPTIANLVVEDPQHIGDELAKKYAAGTFPLVDAKMLADAQRNLNETKAKAVSLDVRPRDPRSLYEDDNPIALVRDPKIDLDNKKITFPVVTSSVILGINKSYQFQNWKLACGSTQVYNAVRNGAAREFSYAPLTCKIVGNR